MNSSVMGYSCLSSSSAVQIPNPSHLPWTKPLILLLSLSLSFMSFPQNPRPPISTHHLPPNPPPLPPFNGRFKIHHRTTRILRQPLPNRKFSIRASIKEGLESSSNTTLIIVSSVITVILAVANRVLYKLALVPMKDYPFFWLSSPLSGFEKLSALRKLETLNLKWNDFDDSILPSLSALRSLKMLNLCANNIGGLFPPQELIYLGNLERLDLSSIQFNDIQGESVTNLQLGSMAIVHSQSSSFMRSMPLVFEDRLTKSSALYSLNIERCSITSRTIQKVADSLGSESVLSQICLGYNNPISSNAIVNLLAKLASLKRFSELNLNGLKLSKHVVDGLCQLSQTSCLSPMMLGDTSIGNDGALQLIESLSNGTHELMKLDLSSCGLTSQNIFRLNDEVSLTSSIVDLNLRGNQIMQEELLLRELPDAEVVFDFVLLLGHLLLFWEQSELIFLLN